MFGHERVAQPSVGDLAGELEVPGSERRDHHRDRVDRCHHRADPGARTVRAGCRTPRRGGRGAHPAVLSWRTISIVSRIRRARLAEQHTVPRLHDARTTRPQPEYETTTRQLLYRHRLHCEHGRRAGTHLHDARREPQRRRDGRKMGERGSAWFIPPRLGDPDQRRSHPLALADERYILGGRHHRAPPPPAYDRQ